MSDFFELFDLMERDLIDAGIGAPALTYKKAYEAPGDDFPAPPVNSGSDFPEPPVSGDEPDDYDTSLDAANQEIEDAGNAAVSDDFPEPPVSDESEEPMDDGATDDVSESDEEVPIEEDIPETEETPTEDPMIEYKKIMKIHSNMKRLLGIVQNSRDSFEQKFSSKISGNQYAGYHKIINTFDDLYEVTERVLTNEFSNGNYKSLIKQYVSLVKVYDIITKMTENFIEAYIKENSETNS